MNIIDFESSYEVLGFYYACINEFGKYKMFDKFGFCVSFKYFLENFYFYFFKFKRDEDFEFVEEFEKFNLFS